MLHFVNVSWQYNSVLTSTSSSLELVLLWIEKGAKVEFVETVPSIKVFKEFQMENSWVGMSHTFIETNCIEA